VADDEHADPTGATLTKVGVHETRAVRACGAYRARDLMDLTFDEVRSKHIPGLHVQ
jgi:hypothetical protein